MCGIIGFNWSDKSLAKKMCDIISHRGPDDSGIYTDKFFSLGHRRLSILDLSKKGHQPMSNEDNTLWLVFNGEIYNHLEIKKALKNKHKFNSTTDTETIIHGYEENGEKIFSMLEGMFSLALWDLKNKKLILARDRIGKKPLYYFFNGKKLIFSSEIKSILLDEEVKREIDYQCLSNYLSMRFSTSNLTMFKGIKKIPSGNFAVFQNNKLELKKHWNFPKLKEKNKPDNKKLDSLLSNAVEKRLMSDVPIGVFLSGGLDSSTIVAYMSRFTDKIKTFSAGFGDNTDETKYAEIVSRKFNTENKIIPLNLKSLDALPKIVWHSDEPLSDPAILPTYHLCENVSKKVKVALSGEGGDEVFGGYGTFNYISLIKRLSYTPKILNSILSKSSSFASNYFVYPHKQMLLLASEIIKEKNISKRHKKLFYLPFEEDEKKKLIIEDIKKKVDLTDPIDNYLKLNESPFNNEINYYYKEWLPNDLLMKVDKTSMAHGLEVRCPFLDSSLIEYYSKLGFKDKLNRKHFRAVVKNILPEEIMRKKKQGFTLPLSNWIKNNNFKEIMKEGLESLKERKIFLSNEIDNIINHPENFKNDHKIWVLYNFEIWNKIYLDKVPFHKIKI